MKRKPAKKTNGAAPLNSEMPDEFKAVTNVEVLPVAKLKMAPKNPRIHTEANVQKIAHSIRTYGWTTPIFVSDKLEVIAGHGRIHAARQLGITEAPCIRLSHLSPKLVEAYRIADNRLGLDSDWDEDILGSVLSDLKDDPEWDQLFTGFGAIEVASRLGLELDYLEEWAEMPEYDQRDKTAFRSIMVHFADQKSVDEFARLLNAAIGPETRYIWFPKIEIESVANKRYRSKRK